jgi:hypothetical protein
MPTPQSVEAMVAITMRDVLIDHCITRVANDDKSRANIVIIGKPTEELRKKNVLSVFTVHPLGPQEDTETIMEGAPTKPNERPYKWPAETIGGMRTYKMLGAVQINLRQNVDGTEALVLIGAIESRIRSAVNNDMRLRVFRDDFGNMVHLIEVYQASGYASGGGDTSLHRRWIDWRGTIHSSNRREGE